MLYTIFLIAVVFLGVVSAFMQWPLVQGDKSFYFSLLMKIICVFVAVVATLLLFGVVVTSTR